MNETVIVQDARLDPDRFILENVDTSQGPTFKVSQIGEIFFARTAFWVRWLEDEHKLVLDGDPDCKHYAATTKMVEQIKDGQATTKEVKAKDSWIVDGVCARCGGKRVGTRKTQTGSRVYTLTDIEQMVHALAANGSISGAHAANALLLVQTMARIHGYLP